MTTPTDHVERAGNHGDVLKHIVYRSIVKALQIQHPEGLCLVDAFCGNGLYDLSEQTNCEFESGIMRVAQSIKEAPLAVKNYLQLVKAADQYMQFYPGSAILSEKLLRPEDDLRLNDLYVTELDGVESPRKVENLDSWNEESLKFFLGDTDRHTVVLIDPPYAEVEDFYRAKCLMENILKARRDTTVAVYFPLIHGNRHRFGYHKMLKESAQKLSLTGHYSASITVQKEGWQGSVVFIANPTKDFDTVLDEPTMDWLSKTLVTSGRSDYIVEQWEKRIKQKEPVTQIELHQT